MRLAFLFSALLSVLVFTPSLVSAQPVTHMGVHPDNHITLEATCLSSACASLFKRTLHDGTTEADFFEIPRRHVLVVTDVDWSFQGVVLALFAPLFSNHQMELRLLRSNDSIQATNRPFISAASLWSSDMCDDPLSCKEAISAGSNTQMTSGFVVSEGTKLRFERSAENLTVLEEHQTHIKVRGYLLPLD